VVVKFIILRVLFNNIQYKDTRCTVLATVCFVFYIKVFSLEILLKQLDLFVDISQ